jgi:hypothetical protein
MEKTHCSFKSSKSCFRTHKASILLTPVNRLLLTSQNTLSLSQFPHRHAFVERMANTEMFLRNSSRIRARRINYQAKNAVRDHGIATQELLKWQKKYAARGSFLTDSKLGNQKLSSKY